MKSRINIYIITFLCLIPFSIFAQQNTLVELDDFYPEEVETAGFSLPSTQEISITVSAISPYRASFPFTDAWIINSKTRDLIWLLEDADEVDRDHNITKFEGKISLDAGNYEVYYSTYVNDRNRHSWYNREHHGFFGRLFHNLLYNDDYNDWEIRRRDFKELYFEITGNGTGYDENQVYDWQTALQDSSILHFTGVQDDFYEEKVLNVTKPVKLKVYAVGEATYDGDYDFGWIVNLKTREKVWKLDYDNSAYAGGAKKNRLSEEVITLDPGQYKVAYASDDSHSYMHWNAAPPYDPSFWGITLWLVNDQDKDAVTVQEAEQYQEKNVIVDFERVGDNEYLTKGFTLKKPLTLHIYALGEGRDGEMYDYGWIVDSKTHDRIWAMDYYETEHAGGAGKNRLFDGNIKLEPGNYIAHYISDGSHSYRRWNAAHPINEKKWGMQINVQDDNYVKGDVQDYNESEDKSVLVRINRVGNYDRMRASFKLDKAQPVHIYAIGEGSRDEMYDYAWIKNAHTGTIVWEMNYRETERAGGARKNRLFDDNIFLEAGEYNVFYRTDDSHSFGSWNDRPPYDPENWGITITKVEK